MLELTPENYIKVFTLLNKIPFNSLFARVVVEHKVKGRVFVDDALNPTVCLIIHKYGMAFLCGNYENDFFNNKLVGFLKNNSLNNNTAKWMIAYPEQWENKLRSLLGRDLIKIDDIANEILQEYKKTHILQTERVNFKFNRDLFSNNTEIPEGFTLKRIDSEIYEKISGSVIPRYFWDTAEDFLENGIGFSLLYEDQVVSTCFSAFIVDDKLELGIETSENFRRKGYSIYPATALVKYCLSKGYEPVWGCNKENIGSYKIAQKLGFLPSSFHPYYCIPVK